MKRRLIIEIICGVLIFIVGYFIGDASAVKRVNKQIDVKVANQQEKTMKKKEEEKKETKIYKLGEDGITGNWNIKALEVKETDTVEGGNSSHNKTTKDKFIVIKLQMKNVSKQPVQYSPREFMLGNIKDKTQYTINDTAFEAMSSANGKETIFNRNSDFIGVYTDVNPNTTKQTYVVFEVPKDMNIPDSVLINANGGAEATGFYIK